MWTDTHSHAYSDEYENPEATVTAALQAGVTQLMLPNVDEHSVAPMLRLTTLFPDICLPMLGLHPCYVQPGCAHFLDFVEKEITDNRYVGVGEIGLDKYHDTTHIDLQKRVFERQMALAVRHDLPVSIHCREAFDETMEMIETFPALRGVFHCFGGDKEMIKRVLDTHLLPGIGGVVTFKKSTDLQAAVVYAGAENIVLETDAPYLAPVPYRGKQNQPAYLTIIGTFVSELLNIPAPELAEITTRNANGIFRKEASRF